MTPGAYITANGAGVIRAHVLRPRIGAWHAELVVDAQDEGTFTGPVALVVAGLNLQGFAKRSGAHHQTVFVRIVGGAGGLGSTVQPRSWQNVPIRIPLSDALTAVGERLSPTADASTLGTILPKWSRPQRSAGVEVGALLSAVPGAAWRVLSDGTIWVGPETWPEKELDFTEIEFQPSIGRLEFASDVPDISPGQTFSPNCGEPYASRRVSSVEHTTEAGRLRNFVVFEDAGAVDNDSDRLTRGLTSFVRSIVGAQLDTLALYPARVVAQNADGTLELKPDDPRWPGFSKVPIRLGIPGATVKLTAGRVLLGFAGGDPQSPIAELWEGGATVTEIALAGGAQYVALGQDVRDELDDIRTKFASHTHVLTIAAATGSGGTGTAAVTTATLAAAKTVKATKVKAT